MTTATIKNTIDKKHKNLMMGKSTRERIMASTMSVDQYFDELIDLVREDYANLYGDTDVSCRPFH